MVAISGCRGSSPIGLPALPPPLPAPAAPIVNVDADIKQLVFSWAEVAGASSYRLLENADGHSGFTQVGGDIPAGTLLATLPVSVHMHDFANALYIVEACNITGCNGSSEVDAMTAMLGTIGYFKASNTEPNDDFGRTVALSADGRLLAVGAPLEDSDATGIDGDQTNNNAVDSGAVYVFRFDGTGWAQEAYIKASNTDADDQFGDALALSGDGSTLAVGARWESSDATGIDGDQASNLADRSGAIYVFHRDGTEWSQQAYVKASNSDASDVFGAYVALSGDGNRLVVGAPLEDSAATGVDGNLDDNTALAAGAVYVFDFDGNNWSQAAYIKASNTDAGDSFARVALSSDGDTLAVGAVGEDGGSNNQGGDESDNSVSGSGAVYVLRHDGLNWVQEEYLKAPAVEDFSVGYQFGFDLALSADGNMLAVSSPYEASSATGINGNWFDSSADQAGAAYIYQFGTTTWGNTAYIKASNTESGDLFGWRLTLSADGSTLAAGARLEDGNSSGVGGDENGLSFQSGAAYVYRFDGIDWSQQAYVKASNNGSDSFGVSVALGGDGDTLAVGATQEDSAATGINGDQDDNSSDASGAVYLY